MKLKKLFSREYSVQYCEAAIRSLSSEVKEYIPHVVNSQCYIPEQGNQAGYFDAVDVEAFEAGLVDLASNKDKLDDFVLKFHKYGRDYVEISNQIGSSVSSDTSPDQLLEYYNQYTQILHIYSAHLWMGHWLNNIISKSGQKLFDKKEQELGSSVDVKVHSALFSPEKKNGILLLHEQLLKMRDSGITDPLESDFQDIMSEYSWMPCLDLQNDPWTYSDFKKYFDDLPNEHLEEMSFEDAIQVFQLNSEELELFKRVRAFSYIKDARDVYRRKAILAILPLFDVIAAQVDLSRHDIAYFTYEEIHSAIKGKTLISDEELLERKNGFFMRWQDNTIEVSTDQDKILEFVNLHIPKATSTEIIKGTTASKGFVTGIVKIVLGVKDLDKVEKGDVLVANTTHPDFVPAMQRAGAFVTDEGGLTSHAAIVAREMGKPCIVGTGIATSFLKDGMKVEVDAIRGVINIL